MDLEKVKFDLIVKGWFNDLKRKPSNDDVIVWLTLHHKPIVKHEPGMY